MSNNLKLLARITASILLVMVVISTLPGSMNSAQAMPANGPGDVKVKIFVPILNKPAIVTPLGAYLDAPGLNNGLTQMSAADTSWVRIPIYWSYVEPTAGQITWLKVTSMENKLKAVNNNHISPILYINDTPKWALKAGFNCGPVAHDNFSAMADFMTAMVKRYSAQPFNVQYYELWSEQDAAGTLGCWGDPSDPNYFGGTYYAEMLKVAYPAIKAANPHAKVLFGGLLLDCDADHIELCGSNTTFNMSVARFLEGALIDGAGPYFDGISFHAYDYCIFTGSPLHCALGQYGNSHWAATWATTGPVAMAKGAYLRDLLARYNVTGKFLMNTELALLCGGSGAEDFCTTPEHEPTVSAYIVEGMATGKADGLTAMIWFSVAGWRGSGLLDRSLNPLPAYYAYKVARAKLGEAAYSREVTDFANVKCYEFWIAGHHLWVMWTIEANSTPQTVTLGSTPAAVYDMYGASLPASKTLDVGLPVYVEFTN